MDEDNLSSETATLASANIAGNIPQIVPEFDAEAISELVKYDSGIDVRDPNTAPLPVVQPIQSKKVR